MTHQDGPQLESVLRDDLAHGDVVIGTIAPILGHLLANHDNALFSDEIVARVRGMVASLAAEIVRAEAKHGDHREDEAVTITDEADLAARLSAIDDLLVHCHALALEWQLALRFERRIGLDPSLSPLLQELIASQDTAIASGAMQTLTAQARFMQTQRRMELPLQELPGDLFHAVLVSWRELAGEDNPDCDRAELALREAYDESESRLGLLARLVASMGSGARAALSVGHAGVALFATTLARLSEQPRSTAILSTTDRQFARLALSLRAAGLKPLEIEEQFLNFHPDIDLPESFDTLRIDTARGLLAEAGPTGD